MTNSVIDLLDEKVIEFNSRIDGEPEFSKMIEGTNRTICICVSDGDNYSTKLESMRIEDFVKTESSNFKHYYNKKNKWKICCAFTGHNTQTAGRLHKDKK